jgi:hypothetical protein
MSRTGALLLGARFALAAGGRARARLVLSAAGVALGALLVLVALAVLPTAAARSARLDARTPALVKGAAPAPHGVVVNGWKDRYLGRPISVFQVARVGRHAPVPPGLGRLPRPGEQAVSPAMRELLGSPDHRALARRYRGRTVALVGPAGLVGPGELVVWTGARRSGLPGDLPVAPSFGAVRQDVTPLPASLRVPVLVGVTGLLVPVLALAMTATRLGSDERDRRLAAVRLVGATPAEARLMSAAEGGLAAVAGSAAAVLAFAALRPLLSRFVPVEGGVFAADVRPPLARVGLVVVGLPLLATAGSVLAQRRVRTSPLGVVRRAPRRRLSGWRLLPLLAGLVLLAAAYADRSSVAAGQGRGAVLLAGGAGLVLAGLAVASPLLGQLAAGLAARFERTLPVLLAARRVQADPAAAARVVTAGALLVFVGGWLLSFLPLAAPANGGVLRRLGAEVEPATFVVATSGQGAPAGLAGVPGVRAVADLPVVQVSSERTQETWPVTAFDCASLNGVLRHDLPACDGGEVYVAAPSSVDGPSPLAAGGRFEAVREVDGGQREGGGEGLPLRRLGAVRLPPARAAPLDGLETLNVWALVPAGALPRRALESATEGSLLVATDGSPSTVEQVRTLLQRGRPGGPVRTVEELVEEAEATTTAYRRIALFGLAVAAFAACCSLAVTLTDSVRERRRSLAALLAAGVPAGTLRAAVLGQTALTVVPSAALALACSVVASSLHLRIEDRPGLSLPWPDMLALAAGAVVAVLAAVSATLPALRAATGRDGLTVD